MTDDTTSKIQDAEIIDSPSSSPVNPSASAFDIETYNATINIVRQRLTLLEKAQEELKKLKEMYDDFFVNDAFYNDAEKQVKEVQNRKKEVKSKLAKQPQALEVAGKINDLKQQINDNLESLSQELMEYYKTSGVTEIEDAEGNVQEFDIKVKLKAKKRMDK